MTGFAVPLIGVVAFSGTGKTTLLTKLIPVLNERGLRVGIVKHAHHSFDIDHPGKDSYELRHAGAAQVAVASRERIAWIREYRDGRDDSTLQDALAALDTSSLDLVIVEGFKREHFPKIELHRPSRGKPLLCTDDRNIIALASDERVDAAPTIPQLDLNNVNEIAGFILSNIRNDSDGTPVYAV